VLTLVATGLRWGEATALTAGDVDLPLVAGKAPDQLLFTNTVGS